MMKIKKIAEAIKNTYNEYLKRKNELGEKLARYELLPQEYLEVLVEKNIKEILGENMEVRLVSESRGFIINGSALYEFIIYPLANSSVVTVYKYYLKDQITL
jgi:hypothetical protein